MGGQFDHDSLLAEVATRIGAVGGSGGGLSGAVEGGPLKGPPVPPIAPTRPDMPEALRRVGLVRLDASRLVSTPPPEPVWLLDGMIERGEVVLLTGRGKTGKSMVALWLCAAVLRGGSFLTRDTTRADRVVYLDAENRSATVHRRLHLCGFSADLAARLDYFLARGLDLRTDEALAALEQIAVDSGLVVLDSLVGLHRADENSATEVRAFMAGLRGVAERTGAAIVCLAHENRAGDTRGSLDWRNAPDAVLQLTRDDAGWRTLKVADRRDGSDSEAPAVFRFVFREGRLWLEENLGQRAPSAVEVMAEQIAPLLRANPRATQSEVARQLATFRDNDTFRKGWAIARAKLDARPGGGS